MKNETEWEIETIKNKRTKIITTELKINIYPFNSAK